MTLQIQFLHSHDFFAENLGSDRDGQGERLHDETAAMIG
jgi:hypothetical protein